MPASISTSSEGSVRNVGATSGFGTDGTGLVLAAERAEDRLQLALDGELSPRHMREALLDAQRLVSSLKQEVKTLNLKVADLDLAQTGSARSAAAENFDRDIKHLANAFQFLFSPFVTASSFDENLTKPLFKHDDPIRYDNEYNEALGMAAELFFWVPENHHTYMLAAGMFAIHFCKAISATRSSMILCLRSEAHKIFGLSSTLFDSKATKELKENSPELRSILGCSKPSDDPADILFPPIFFKDSDSTNINGLFLNVILFVIARIILYGPTSAGNENAAIRANSPFCVKGRVISVTPATVAWPLTMLRYVASSDTEMNASGVGANLGINYKADFDTYKKIIIRGRVENPGWYALLMLTWNERLFPMKRSQTQATASDGDNDGLKSVDEGVTNAVDDLFRRMAIANKSGPPASGVVAGDAVEVDSELDNEIFELSHPTAPAPQPNFQPEDTNTTVSTPKLATAALSARQPRVQAFAPLPASAFGAQAFNSQAAGIASSSNATPVDIQLVPVPIPSSGVPPKKTRGSRKVNAAVNPPAPRTTRSHTSGPKVVRK